MIINEQLNCYKYSFISFFNSRHFHNKYKISSLTLECFGLDRDLISVLFHTNLKVTFKPHPQNKGDDSLFFMEPHHQKQFLWHRAALLYMIFYFLSLIFLYF